MSKETNDKVYTKGWFLWLMIIFITPVGLFLLWKYYPNMDKKVKIIITIIFMMWFIYCLSSNSNQSNNYSSANTDSNSNTESKAKTDNKSSQQNSNGNIQKANEDNKNTKQEQDNNSSKKKTVKNNKTTPKNTISCDDDSTYMFEYETILSSLYIYGHKINAWEWVQTIDSDTECQYHTILKIKNMYGVYSDHHLYINTILDQENQKEHVNQLIVDNVMVYEKS